MKSSNKNQIRALTILAFEILDDALVQWLQFCCCVRREKLQGDVGIFSVGIMVGRMVNEQ